MTSQLRIINAEPFAYSPEAQRILTGAAEVVEGPFTRAGLLAAARDADALIVRLGHRIDQEFFLPPTRLRILATATTGLNHIDLDAAAAAGASVLSLQGEFEFLRTIRATVEHTFALALTLLRRTHRASAHVEAGGWDRDRFRGHELAGRRLGLIGLGRIGSAVAEIARAFQMEVQAYDPYREDWPDVAVRVGSLQELLEDTELLSLHVPLSNETVNMIGANELSTLPRGAYVLNTSRGGVLDEGALLAQLAGGHLAGAALDVLRVEEDRGSSEPLKAWAREHDTLVLTPHIGGATWESMARTEVFMAKKLVRVLAGTRTGER